MRNLLLCGVLAGITTLTVPRAFADEQDEHQSFAVVELFTSQGCSSCPPADRVLKTLRDSAKEDGTRVFVLSYHVDYWDRLGWNDPFSDAAHSKRQEHYARHMQLRAMYTPQMVVNGKDQFVGSKAEVAEKTVEAALQQQATASIEVSTAQGPDGSVTINAKATGSTEDTDLHIVLVQHNTSTEVTKGENTGRDLVHASVARAFVTRDISQNNVQQIKLPLPEGLNPDEVAIITFTQHRKTLHITGATTAPVALGNVVE